MILLYEMKKEMEELLGKIDKNSPEKIPDEHEIYTVFDKWYKKDSHRYIVDFILQIPEEKWTEKLILELARAYNNTWRFSEAIDLLTKYDKMEKQEEARWYYMYGYAYDELNQFSVAVEYLEKSLELDPDRKATKELYEECKIRYAHAVGLVKRRKGKSKKFELDYDDWEENGTTSEDVMEQILNDPELPELEEIVIGAWEEPYGEGCQTFIDGIINNKEKFSHIKSLFFGDMESEDCEVSWIIQGNYEGLLEALPQLEALTIKGSTDLVLGKLKSKSLKHLEIICGGLPETVLADIEKADLPQLECLNLYLGDSRYGFDFDKSRMEIFLKNAKFPKLKYLGLNDSEIQDEVAEVVCKSDYINQVEVLDFSGGALTDKGGSVILETVPKYDNIKKVDMHYHYMSEDMMEQLQSMSCEVDISEGEDPDDKYMVPILTE